jgi:Zn-dependent protease
LAAHGLDFLPLAAAEVSAEFLEDFILINLALGLFNLLPIPPLDGGRIIVGLLPEGLARRWAGLEKYGIVIVLLLLFIAPEMARDFGHHFNPVQDSLEYVLPRARNLVLLLSGNAPDE